jgi:hypothetical protein
LIRAIPVPARQVLRFHRAHGRLPPRCPTTFNEKVHWRVRHDRRPLLAGTCDKLAMKDYALRMAPGLVRIPETVWFGKDVAELAQVDLPPHWVLKPNDASGLVLFGHGAASPDELALRTEGWLNRRYRRQHEEWAYRQARPGFLVEEFIGAPGEVPADLKVLVFDGIARIVGVHTSRSTVHRNRLYTPDWDPLPWTGGYARGPDAPRPQRLEDMLKAASALAAGFDMLRVDFYEHEGVLWFGELTPYPGGGCTRIEAELDHLQGRWWTLPSIPPRWVRRSAIPGVGISQPHPGATRADTSPARAAVRPASRIGR